MATGTMVIKYKENDIRNKANAVADKLDDAYDHVLKIDNKISKLEERSSKNYLNSASAFLRKKRTTLTTKRDSAQAFAARVDAIMDQAKDVDGRVANHIEDTYEEFKQITGINDSIWAAIGNFIVSSLKALAGAIILSLCSPIIGMVAIILAGAVLIDFIKHLYSILPQFYKYLLKTAAEVLGLIAAIAIFISVTVATGGTFTLVIACVVGGAALFKIADSTMSVLKSATVLVSYCMGRVEYAERLDKVSNAEIFGNTMDGVLGIDSKAWAMSYACTSLTASIITIAYNIGNIGAAIKSDGLKKGLLGELNPFKDFEKFNKLKEFKDLPLLAKLSKDQAALIIEGSKGLKAVCDVTKSYLTVKSSFIDGFDEGALSIFKELPVIDKASDIREKHATIQAISGT